MTEITIFKKADIILGFSSSGHADEIDDLGSVVCNGVSSLTLTSILSLRDVAHILEEDMLVEQEDGYLYLKLKNNAAEKKDAQIILQSLVVGLNAIQENYKKYLKVKIQEVSDDSF